MKCPKCGREFLEGLDYCIYCEGASANMQQESSEEVDHAPSRLKEVLETQTKEEEQKKAEQADKIKHRLGEHASNVKRQSARCVQAAGTHKKVTAAVGVTVAVLLAAILAIAFVPACKARYLNLQGNWLLSSDPAKAKEYFNRSKDLHENPGAEVGMIRCCISEENYDMAAILLSQATARYGDAGGLGKLKAEYAPGIPAANVESGTYDSVQRIQLEIRKPGKVPEYIMYSLNGSEPKRYTEDTEIVLNQRQEYQLDTWAESFLYLDGAHQSYKYNMDLILPKTVVADLEPGTYTTWQKVKLESPEGYDVYYTTDGTDPGEDAKKYQDPIDLPDGVTEIKAVTYDPQGVASEVFCAEYKMDFPVPKDVVISLEGGEYHETQTVELSAETGDKIYYTLDGTIPSEQSFMYENPINIDFGITQLKALAMNEYGKKSSVASSVYEIAYDKYGPGLSRFLSTPEGEFAVKETTIVKYTKDMKENTTLVDNVSATNLRKAGDKLFYREGSDSSVHAIDLSQENSDQKIGNAAVRSFELAHDSIYFTGKDDGYLYRMDMGGGDLTKVYDRNVSYMQNVGGILYFASEGTIKYMNTLGGEISDMPGSPSGIRYFCLGEDGTLCYVLNGKLHVRRGETDTVVMEDSEDTWSTNATLFREGEDHTVTDNLQDHTMVVCNNTLYIRSDHWTHVNYISGWTHTVTSSDSDTEARWYKVDLQQAKATRVSNNTTSLYVTDRMILDGSFNYTEVVH